MQLTYKLQPSKFPSPPFRDEYTRRVYIPVQDLASVVQKLQSLDNLSDKHFSVNKFFKAAVHTLSIFYFFCGFCV